MKIECRDSCAETNIQEGTVAGGILSYPDYGAHFVISSATTTITTTKNKVVESKLAKNVDKDREQ
jgi:hypothetical protein